MMDKVYYNQLVREMLKLKESNSTLAERQKVCNEILKLMKPQNIKPDENN